MGKVEPVIIPLKVDGKDIKVELQLANDQIQKLRAQALGFTDVIAKWSLIVTGFNQGLEVAEKFYSVLSKPIDAAGQFEQYETSLKVMLGSTEAAKERLEELVEFAKETPFELPQVVEAANQLQALGAYSKETLRYLGDLSSASGKPIDQVLSAFAKLKSGQKGIAVDMFRDLLITTDDWVRATGKQIGKDGSLQASVQEMAEALPKIIKSKGFDGMMAEQAKTAKGMASNTSDALGQLVTEFGDRILPLYKQVMSTLTSGINATRENMDSILPILESLAILVVSYTVSTHGLSAAQFILSGALSKVKAALLTIRAELMANPFTAAVMAITAVTVALYELNKVYGNTLDNQMKLAKAAEEANKALEKDIQKRIEEKKSVEDLKNEYQELTGKLDSGKISAEERRSAEARLHDILLKLKQQYPELIKSTHNYSGELDNVKRSALQAKDEISGLSKQLDEVQKGYVKLKLTTTKLEVTEGFENLNREFRSLTLGGEGGLTLAGQQGESIIKGFNKLAQDLSSGKRKISEVLEELDKEFIKYSNWAASGGENAEFNLSVANKIASLSATLVKLRDYYKVLNNNSKLPESNNEPLSSPIVNPVSGKDKEKSVDLKKPSEYAEEIASMESKTIEELLRNSIETLSGYNKWVSDQFEKETDTQRQFIDEKKRYFDENIESMNNEMLVEQMQYETKVDLNRRLADELISYSEIERKIREASNAEELKDLFFKMGLSQARINLIDDEIKKRELAEKLKVEETETAISAAASEYNAQEKFGVQLNRLTNDAIRRVIAQAVISQIAKALSYLPFPANIILAPAAGLAVQALLEKFIPKFETGGWVNGPAHSRGGVMANLEGDEFIINKRSAQRYAPLLEMINQDKLNMSSLTALLNVRRSLEGVQFQRSALERESIRQDILSRPIELHLDIDGKIAKKIYVLADGEMRGGRA